MLVPSTDTRPIQPNLPRLITNDQLPDGMVLLKNWLSFEEQMRIVETVRNLGVGPGGFYTPIDRSTSPLKLKMMCLGLVSTPIRLTRSLWTLPRTGIQLIEPTR